MKYPWEMCAKRKEKQVQLFGVNHKYHGELDELLKKHIWKSKDKKKKKKEMLIIRKKTTEGEEGEPTISLITYLTLYCQKLNVISAIPEME
uniref:60S ribosomal protein L7a n=1 Tax=Caenorhabditis tropicalis TaxID=1561998 RepID=A0A1I7T0K3_9PELO